MKILLLQDDFPPFEIGGAGVIAGILARGFVKAGHSVFVITTVQSKQNEGVYEENGIKIYRIYSNYHDRWRAYLSIYNPQVLSKVRKIISEINPDITHAHNVHFYLSYFSLKIAKLYSKKVYMTCHDIMPFYPGTFTEFINPDDLSIVEDFNYKISQLILFKKFKLRYNPLRNLIIRKILSRLDGVFSVSQSLRDALVQNNISVKAVVYNGIEDKGWSPSDIEKNNFRNNYGLVSKDIVLFQGRLSGSKGGILILNAMKEVVSTNPNATLLVVGKRDGYDKLMQFTAEKLGIKDNVIFTGWMKREDIKHAYASSDVVVIPSVCFDSFPNGNLEAFIAKRPVVSTCFGGSREIVVDNQNGFIVNPFNIKSLSSSISYLLKNKDIANKFGDNGYKLIKEKFTTEIMIQNYINFFK